MVDVHSHIIPFVDDGSKSLEISLEMLRDEERQGVTDVVFTPHYRKGRFITPDEEVKTEFEKLKLRASEEGISLRLYLGREITVDERSKGYIKKGEFISFAGTKYVLLEFPFTEKTDIDEICYEVMLWGYIPIVAHVERYHYFRDYDLVSSLRQNGALVQVNAQALAGASSIKENRFAKGLFKRKIIDFVGSDIHSTRFNYMSKAYQRCERRDSEYAKKIFEENAMKILNDLGRFN